MVDDSRKEKTWEEMRKAKEEEYFKRREKEALARLQSAWPPSAPAVEGVNSASLGPEAAPAANVSGPGEQNKKLDTRKKL